MVGALPADDAVRGGVSPVAPPFWLEQVAYRPLRKRGGTRLAALISAIGRLAVPAEFFKLFVIGPLTGKPGQNDVAVHPDHQPCCPVPHRPTPRCAWTM